MKRQLGWGLVGAALVALALPLAGGALAFAAPALPASPGSSSVAEIKPPPPPVSKHDPVDTPTLKPPAPVAGDDDTGRQAVVQISASGCGGSASGSPGSAPATTSAKGVKGTTTADLAAFAQAYNQKRVANCLKPIPMGNFRYDSCMETRLFWIAEDPSTNPASAWGHIGTQRSDGVPSVGCDGNLAGGMSNTGATVAVKWWDSTAHRTALYKPSYTGSTASVCIFFAMTHGGVPDEPTAFARAAARWGSC